jgi:hypothetical protein
LNDQRSGTVERTVYFLVPPANEIENKIEIVSPAKVSKEPPTVVLALENEFKEFLYGFEVVIL